VPAPARGTAVRAFVRAHGVLLSAVAWLLLVLNFARFHFGTTDELIQYGFVQRLYGDSHQHSAYLFGLAIIEAPFYGVGKVIGKLGLDHPAGHPITQVVPAVAFGLATLLVWPLLAPVLRGLRLPAAGRALLFAALGMPLLFYATFHPTKSHGLECVLFSVAILLVFRLFTEDTVPRWLPFALGGSLGLITTVRYLDAALGVALVGVLLAYRQIRTALEVSIGGIVVAAALAALPLAMGATLTLTEAPQAGTLIHRHVPLGGYTFMTPVAMLFSNQRGMFLWSPISVLALAGLVALWRRRPEHRRFLTTIYVMSVALVLFQGVTPWFTGGFGFAQRYLTVLMPLVAIGVAGAILAWRRVAVVISLVCVGWTMFLFLNFVTIGRVPWWRESGVTGLAGVPWKRHISPGAYVWGVRYQSNFLHWTVK
jgi:hypothetical protein